MWDLVRRVTTESRITAEGIREALIAVSERVNRRVEILRLHWHAATIRQQIQESHRTLGVRLRESLAPAGGVTEHRVLPLPDVTRHIRDAAGNVASLKKELVDVEGSIRNLELEGLREEFLKVQQDFAHRGFGMLRVVVAHDAVALGQRPATLPLPDGVGLVAVVRGPIVLLPLDPVALRSHDVVILIGPHPRLAHATALFQTRGDDSTARA